MPLPGFLNSISQETLLVLAAYVVLGGTYLVAVPLAPEALAGGDGVLKSPLRCECFHRIGNPS